MSRAIGNRNRASGDSKSITRLRKELLDMSSSPPPLCSASLENNNIYEWIATIVGPPESPYEGGEFKLSIKFTKNYPFEPPKVRFLTRVYHCNVDTNGNICLDILTCNWSPAMTVSTLLLSICSVLTDPNPENPLRLDIAMLYLMNRDEHDRRARQNTRRHSS